jgi:lipoprotein-anchoring transpeptidase ErfK/SrfK
VETPIITGRPGLNTPTGTFHILYKQSPASLMGGAPVTYWMPFTTAGHGLHDASWQNGIFGGSRYLQGFGSHGCVNMPFAAAQATYSHMNAGDIVYVHY